jgi:hypothetical protein
MGSACYSGGIRSETTHHFWDIKANTAGGQTYSQEEREKPQTKRAICQNSQ